MLHEHRKERMSESRTKTARLSAGPGFTFRPPHSHLGLPTFSGLSPPPFPLYSMTPEVPKRQTGLYYKVGYKVTTAPRGGHLGRPRQSGSRVSPAPGTRTRASTRVTAAGLPSSIGKKRSVSSRPPPQVRGAKVTRRPPGRQSPSELKSRYWCVENSTWVSRAPRGTGWPEWVLPFPHQGPGVAWPPGVENWPKPMGQRRGEVRLPHSPLEIPFKETHYE